MSCHWGNVQAMSCDWGNVPGLMHFLGFRVLMMTITDKKNETSDWGKCLGLPVGGYVPDSRCYILTVGLTSEFSILNIQLLQNCSRSFKIKTLLKNIYQLLEYPRNWIESHVYLVRNGITRYQLPRQSPCKLRIVLSLEIAIPIETKFIPSNFLWYSVWSFW